MFRTYPWRGNVRELRNVIERVMILEDGDLITTTYLPRGLGKNGSDVARITMAATPSAQRAEIAPVDQPQTSGLRFQLPPDGVVLADVEMSLVRQALQHSNGNQTKAAELLGISRDQLRYRLKKLEEPAPQE
jgi:DNA-binding NtrC family response regulator